MNHNLILGLVTFALVVVVVVISNPSLIPTLLGGLARDAQVETEFAIAQPRPNAPPGGGNSPLGFDELAQEAQRYATPPTPPRPPKKPLFEGGLNWKVAGILFLAEFAGVLSSFTLLQPVLKSGQSIFGLSLTIAVANLAALLSTRAADAPIKAVEVFQYVKDGLVWPAALPAIAAAVGVATSAKPG